jgi:hypothetical protein
MELRVAKETRNSGRPCGCLRLSRTYDGSGDHQFSVGGEADLRVEYRSAEGHPERLPELAGELVASQPDVLIAHPWMYGQVIVE